MGVRWGWEARKLPGALGLEDRRLCVFCDDLRFRKPYSMGDCDSYMKNKELGVCFVQCPVILWYNRYSDCHMKKYQQRCPHVK